MELLLFFVFSFWLGFNFAIFRMRREIAQLAKEKGINLDLEEKTQTKPKEIPLLEVEKHGEMLYLFERETNNFMCQGVDLQDLATKLIKYKNVDLAFVKHGDETLWFVDGKVTNNPNES